MIRIAAQVLTEAMRLNGSATAKLTHVCEAEPAGARGDEYINEPLIDEARVPTELALV